MGFDSKGGIMRPLSTENSRSISLISLPKTPLSRSIGIGGYNGTSKCETSNLQNQATVIAPLLPLDVARSRSGSPTRHSSPLVMRLDSDVGAGCSQLTEDFLNMKVNGQLTIDGVPGGIYTGNISVAIRIKPSESSRKDPWYASNNKLIHTEFGEFQFDHVYTKEVLNHEIYHELGQPIVDKLFQGFNTTILAYGMTGSGKTFTMSGDRQEPGLIPLCVANIFDRIECASDSCGVSYKIKVSYLEIYNEKILDLLAQPEQNSRQFNRSTGGLKIRDDTKYGVKVIDLTEQKVNSHSEVMKWISMGDKVRKTGETDFNTRSSRSHAIVLLRITKTDKKSGFETTSTLSLCDLAGSERAVTQLVRRQEGSYINKSLLALGTVIAKLSSQSHTGSTNGQQAAFGGGHIPYRDSKLTRILQPALSSDSIITTICTIDTKSDLCTETANTVRFASRAKNVSMSVRRNEYEMNAEKDHIIQQLRKQLDEQHATIAILKRNNARADYSASLSNDDSSVAEKALSMETGLLEIENNILETKLEHCEKLLEKDTMGLEDQHIREILDLLPSDISTVLENKVHGMESQLRQYRHYVQKLEIDIEKAQKNIIETNISQLNQKTTFSIQEKYGNDVDPELLLEEQEAELLELRKALERKDKMIEALQSAHRLRDSAMNQVTTVVLNKKTPSVEDMKNMGDV